MRKHWDLWFGGLSTAGMSKLTFFSEASSKYPTLDLLQKLVTLALGFATLGVMVCRLERAWRKRKEPIVIGEDGRPKTDYKREVPRDTPL